MNKIDVAEVNYFPEGKGTSTPWGRAQYSQQLTRGVVFYGTAGHGGLSVSKKWAQDNLTPHAVYLGESWGSNLWYEEDVACNIVFLEHPDLLFSMTGHSTEPERIKDAVRTWYPEYFDRSFQEAAVKAGSIPLPKDLAQGDKLVLRAYGAPNNERTYSLLGTYNKGKSAIVEDDCGGRYKVTASRINGDLIRVERGTEVQWARPEKT